ncbi:AAA family ATPase [Candidatus Sumerlaeota bacterium]|nr:AAA family ATPase [Candidatus Sumerlaeota bacterium]
MEESNQIQEKIDRIHPAVNSLIRELNQVLLDKERLIQDLVTGILSRGHVLLEGLPGLGKTELVKGVAHLCSVDFKRIQFTPDLLPSDITGSFILQQTNEKREFIFQKGPVFTNILLGDEINRASPKTQSALLEAMQERCVTVMGETFSLPDPFFVMATQNPIEMEGTYPLPEAQVDRFLFKLHLTRPAEGVLSDIVLNRVFGLPPKQEPVMNLEDLRSAIRIAQEIYISEAVASFISRLVDASHPDSPLAPPLVKKYVRYGASPRAAIALGSAARAKALVLGRVQAGFDSVKQLFPLVMNHRIILDYSARIDGVSVNQVMDDILKNVDEYSKSLPSGVRES